jgi:uncharacterized integral membrane protein
VAKVSGKVVGVTDAERTGALGPGEVGEPGQPTEVMRGSQVAVPAPGTVGPSGVKHTRASATWTALAIGLALLVVVLVFILENLQDVKVSFFSVHWRIPLALDLLLAAVLGGLIVFAAGAVRLLQLRMHARRQRSQGGQGDGRLAG